jgi:Carboxypeptidase regulatory-like domain
MPELKRFLIISTFLVLLGSVGFAQQTSSVTGIVTDSTGAAIAGADVKLTNKTGAEQSTKTNDHGVYLFVKVAPGADYKLTFTAQGFDTLEMLEITLGVGITETHNAQMAVGQVTNTVTVTSTSDVTLNTTDATIGNVINTRQLTELPIQIRNSPAALMSLQAGVVGNNLGTTSGNRVGSVTGSRADQGNITVDGIDANDQTTGQAFATVGNAPIDAIQEFRAISTNPNASEGRSSGGQIELVTKSGSNNFHGNVREYNRTAATAANSFFNNKSAIAKPQLTRNQFGASLGGPMYLPRFGEGGPAIYKGKDRLFFFFDYEGRRDAQGVSYLRTVPLDHYRNGGLAYINNTAGCATNSRLNTTPQCITILSRAQVAALDPRRVGSDQSLLDFVNSRYPRANDLTAGDGVNTGGFRFNAPAHRSDNTYTTRIDFDATQKHRVFGRFSIARRLQTDTVNTVAQQFPDDPESGQIAVRDYAWVIGDTWTISPSLVNQATVGVSRSGLEFPRPFAPAFPNSFTFGPLTAPYASISPQSRFVPVPTIRDDVSWSKGSHNLALGFSIKPIKSVSTLKNDLNFPTVGIGGLTAALDSTLRPTDIRVANAVTTNYDSAFAFLLGRYASIATNFNYGPSGNPFPPGTGKTRDFRYNEYEIYGQDTWKVRSNLTVTFGVRWQYYPPPYEADGFQAGNDVDFRPLYDLRQRNALAGISGQNAEPFLKYDLIGKANDGRGYYETEKDNFAPRLFFAYTPTVKEGFLGKLLGDRKTVIRGGGSLVYDRVGGAVTFIQDQVSYLFDNSATTLFGATNPRVALLTDPRFTTINSLPVQNVPPVITRPFVPFVDEDGFPTGNATGELNYAVDQHFKIPYAIEYSFGIQRELPGNLLLDVSYVGRQARKLFSQADASQVLDFKDAASGQFMLSAFNSLQSQIQSGATITAQPWFENQISSAIGAPCSALGRGSCTAFLAGNGQLNQLISRGDTSDTIQLLYANGLLNPNVGLSGQFSTNIYISNQGSSTYNGLLVSLRKRFSKGLQFDFNYTLSNSIDNSSSIVNTVTGGLVCDLRNLRICRGPSDFDIRHIININGIYELPFGKGHWLAGGVPGWVNTIIGGWLVSGIYSWRTGLPFSTTTGAFPVGFNFNSPAVNTGSASILEQSIHDSGSSVQFFKDPTAALATLKFPQNGTIGTRNALRGNRFSNVDLAILKNFRLGESETRRLQFRWEMYNAFNYNVFALPNVSITSTSFGLITGSASAPREMQFALRLEF